MRACELAVEASNSRIDDVYRITTEGADIDVDTIDDVHTSDGAGSGKLDPPAC